MPCSNKAYSLAIRGYLWGQHRLQLMKGDDKHIVREACTYSSSLAGNIAMALMEADDPEAYMESLAKPWNCEGNGLRIRLDNKQADRI